MSQCSSEAFSRAVLSQRIVYVDAYTTIPLQDLDVLHSNFRGTDIKKVPIIRIYGSTTKGEKACAHIHGVFPYLYIEHDANIFNFEQRIAIELDEQINTTLREFNSKGAEHVYKIFQVTGRSFYGYKSNSRTFLKIFFYSPIALTKAVGLFQAGKILGQTFQPYEAHIPFILQFFKDFKLFGMNLIHFANVKYRESAPQYAKTSKKTRCKVEFDVIASDILISNSLTGKNPGIEAIWQDEKERRRQNGILDWTEVTIPASQDRPFDSFIFKREAELMSTLKEQLKPYLDSIHDFQTNIPTTPRCSDDEKDLSQSRMTLTPSSEVSIDDIEMANGIGAILSPQPDEEFEEWNEEDQNMVALLDELAHNRIVENEEEEDSIISSQVLADFEADPFLSFSNDEDADDVRPAEETNQDWDKDFFSSSVCQFLDEFESKASKNSKGDFTIPQSDGQFDSTEDESDSSRKSLPKSSQRKSVSLVRTLSSNSLPSPNRPRIRPPSPPSPVLINSSSDDEDVVILCEKAPPIPKTLLSITGSMTSSSSLKVRGNVTPTSSPLKVTSALSPGKSPNQFRIRRPPTPPSPTIISDTTDSQETDFEESEHDDNQNQVHTAKSASKPNESEVKNNPTGANIETWNSSDEDLPNSGIKSFYHYPADGDLSQFINSVDTDSDSENSKTKTKTPTPSPLSQNLSIHSIYEYSDGSEVDLDDTTFVDVSMSQAEESPKSKSSSSDDGETQEKSDFVRQAKKSKLKLKKDNESYMALKENFFPPVFDWEVIPLKNPPCAGDVDGWSEDAKKCNESSDSDTEIDEEPISIKYFKGKNQQSNSHTGLKRKLVDDILIMRSSIIAKAKNDDRLVEDERPSTSAAAMINQRQVQQKIIRRSPVKIEFSDSDSEDDPIPVKPFRFGGSHSDGEAEVSDESSDTESINNSPAPTPSPQSQKYDKSRRMRTPITPASAGWIARKRRKLNIEADGGNLSPSAVQRQLDVDDSELDSISFTSSQSPGIQSSQLNSSNFQDVKALHECQYLTTMSMEVHCSVRGNLIPDPALDSIEAIFYYIHQDTVERNAKSQTNSFGCFQVCTNTNTGHDSENYNVKHFLDEKSMILEFTQFMQEVDPDILVGYEISRFSWGYLIDRGRALELDIISDLSRLLPLPKFNNAERDNRRMDEVWNESISGRIVFNLWRLLRHEMTVTSYTFENAAFQILHERVHLLSYRHLSNQWLNNQRSKVMSYYKRRVVYVIRIIEKLDLINRTSELARLFGIQFFEVLSRGSQFRVESMMLRLAKAENFIPPSPSPQQRAFMKAPEYLPLIMEPESKFYTDPVAVLDFQSLYPSMMMAYNYCFSTCIGRIQHLGQKGSFEFGCLNQEISPEELSRLIAEDLVHISPCGVAFVKECVQKGILGEMLQQILETRQMVKRSMKKWKNDETLQKVLDSRQLGLKLIANVTYGYTSANYSGRMPCVEIADSVVSKGRETLQRAIDYVKENEGIYHAKVVYGDTDSLFLHFPNRTRAEAFQLSQKIVDEITSRNPKPVKLKLEKVYQPCILQTKKRYVGYAYETPDQVQPKYDAKGIETVRRDGCPATAKILEGALKVLFVTQDESKVKSFVKDQFRKIFLGRVSLSKYTYAREYRGRSGYKPNAVVPSLEIAKRLVEKDPRAEPLRSQRVPYVVVYGNLNVPLIQLIRRPDEFIENHNLRLNAHYYIEKAIIPPLNRCFSLAKMDVGKWYTEMPRKYLKSYYTEGHNIKKGTIDQYFVSESCIKCQSRTTTGFCDNCFSNTEEIQDFLVSEEYRITQKFENCCKICTDCSKEDEMICINMDCPVKHRFIRYDRDYKTKLPKLQSLAHKMSTAMSAW